MEHVRLIAKQKVVGSNYETQGAVPKWLREGSAKPRFVGSNPTRASSINLKFLLSKNRCAVSFDIRI